MLWWINRNPIYTKTSEILLPIVKYKGTFNNLMQDGFINAFVGNYHDTKDDQWGEYIYLVFNSDKLSPERLKEFQSSEQFESLSKHKDHTVFKFTFSPELRETVVKPFLNGKYSLINRQFVDDYHPRHIGISLARNPSNLILTRDESLRNTLETELGVRLPEDAEVYSRPEKENEIYGYSEFLNNTNVINHDQQHHQGS